MQLPSRFFNHQAPWMTDDPSPNHLPTAESELRPAVSPDDVLPPIEAPGAGFILQLFIVPAIIVFVIVMVWFMFSWLARGTDDPRLLIKKLSVSSEARYQAAHELASVLSSKRFAAFKQDREAAADLARTLAVQLKDGGDGDREVNLRIFICRALGEFQVDEGLLDLLQATDSRRHIDVRKAALEAIAIRAEYASQLDLPRQIGDEQLTSTMLALADDQEYQVRERTVIALSWLGGDLLLAKLEEMLEDPHPNVRYNAATSCSRLGNAASVDVLEEMLDPDSAGVKSEPDERLRPGKRANILINALRATLILADANADADLRELEKAIAALAEGDLDRQLRMDAANVLSRLKDRARSE